MYKTLNTRLQRGTHHHVYVITTNIDKQYKSDMILKKKF